MAALLGAAIGAIVFFLLERAHVTDFLRERANPAAASSGDGQGRRLLVIGDSFLDWWPVKHCLRLDLKAYCDERGIGHLNVAFGGAGPYEYLDRLESASEKFRPSAILLFYYAGNDLTDVQYRADETPRKPPTPTAALERAAADRALELLAGIAAFAESAASAAGESEARFDWEAMRRHGIDEGLIAKAKNRLVHPGDISPETVNPYLLELAMQAPTFITDNILMRSQDNSNAWARIESIIQKIAKRAKRLDAEICVVAIPSTVQVDRSHHDFYKKAKFDVPDELLGSTEPQDRMAKLCGGLGIQFIDLLPGLKASDRTGELYWENDDHFSELGHSLAFEIVEREFLQKRLGRSAKP